MAENGYTLGLIGHSDELRWIGGYEEGVPKNGLHAIEEVMPLESACSVVVKAFKGH